MFRIDSPGSVIALPTAGAVGPVVGYFTEGDPVTAVPATIVSGDWANAVQEEIIGVILGAGLTPTKGSNGQLASAIGISSTDVTTNFTIANNTTSAAITGLLFALATFRAVEIEYSIYRKTDSPIEVAAMGKLRLVAKPVANSWDLLPGLEEGDDCGMTFIADVSVPGSVQLRYTSTNLAGANYVGTLRYKISRYKI